jgi:hypothetical protein
MITKTILIFSNTSNIAKLFCFIISLFAPISALIHLLVLLVVIDAFTALWWKILSVNKNEKGIRNKIIKAIHTFECLKFFRTLQKLLFYIITVFVLYYFDTIVLHSIPLNFLGLTSFSLANIATLLISISELTSILKNISKITTLPILSKLMSFLISSNKRFFKKK